VAPASAAADGISAARFTVHLADANGFPVSGTPVSIATTGGPGWVSVTANSGVTDANGDATFSATATQPGLYTFAAYDDSDGVAVGGPARMAFTGPTDMSVSLLADTNSLVLGQLATYRVTIQNLGPNFAPPPHLTLGQGLAFDSASSDWNCGSLVDDVTCAPQPSLWPIGATASFTISARVTESRPGGLAVATIDPAGDLNLANNSSSVLQLVPVLPLGSTLGSEKHSLLRGAATAPPALPVAVASPPAKAKPLANRLGAFVPVAANRPAPFVPVAAEEPGQPDIVVRDRMVARTRPVPR
jgi:hypothetical protein